MTHADIRSDRLERIGDLLPTPEELAELNAWLDTPEQLLDRSPVNADACRLDTRAEFCVIVPSPVNSLRGLAGAGGLELVYDHGFGFGL